MCATRAAQQSSAATLARRLRRDLLKLPGVVESDSVFSAGQAFWVNGTQIAHFIDDDTIELRITRAVWSEHRERLRADERVRRRSASSDWIEVRFASGADAASAVELAELAAAAHAPTDGEPAKPPPTGADLVRRRRLH